MFAQNFFYYTVSFSIIILALLGLIAVVYWLVILRKFYGILDRVDKTIGMLKEKIKISAFMGLISQGLKEVTEFIKEIRNKKKEKKHE